MAAVLGVLGVFAGILIAALFSAIRPQSDEVTQMVVGVGSGAVLALVGAALGVVALRKGERSWVVWLAIASGALWFLFGGLSVLLS